jgi:hypothetical protein
MTTGRINQVTLLMKEEKVKVKSKTIKKKKERRKVRKMT